MAKVFIYITLGRGVVRGVVHTPGMTGLQFDPEVARRTWPALIERMQDLLKSGQQALTRADFDTDEEWDEFRVAREAMER